MGNTLPTKVSIKIQPKQCNIYGLTIDKIEEIEKLFEMQYINKR